MIVPSSFEVMVLGAGLAGLSTADAVLKKGLTCAIIDPEKPGAGASGAPMLLANPAAGRRARKTWRAEKCLEHLSTLLENVQTETKNSCFQQNGVIRPALTKKIAGDFEQSTEKYDWQKDWVEWVDQKTFSEKFPVIAENFGGLLIKKAFTVRGDELTGALMNYLQNGECFSKFGLKPELEYKSNSWRAVFSDGTEIASKFLIDATGYNQIQSGIWDFLPLHPIKGQTATYFFQEPLGLSHSISSLGYMAFMNDTPREITVGSTYEHHFDDLEPSKEGLSYLQNKLDNTLPGLSKKSISVKQWASVRVTVPDKKPVIGAHTELKNLYMIGALGSKGLLMSRYLAELLTNHIFNGEEIDQTVSIDRFW